jgi:hypothetical protein
MSIFALFPPPDFQVLFSTLCKLGIVLAFFPSRRRFSISHHGFLKQKIPNNACIHFVSFPCDLEKMFAFKVPDSEAFFISGWDNRRSIRIEFKKHLFFLPHRFPGGKQLPGARKLNNNSAYWTDKFFAQYPYLPVSHSAASGLQGVKQDKWPSVHRRFFIKKGSMLMKSLYLKARDSASAKPLLNINRAIQKRAFSTAWWLKTSSPFWRGNRSVGVWFSGLWKRTCVRFLIAVFWHMVLCGFTASHGATGHRSAG